MTTVEHGLNREFLQQHFVLGTCIYICFPFFLFLCVCSLHKAIVCMYITMHDDRVHVLCSRLEMKCSVLFYIDSTMFYIRRNTRCRLFSSAFCDSYRCGSLTVHTPVYPTTAGVFLAVLHFRKLSVKIVFGLHVL